MKAIKTQNTMKQLIVLFSVLLFLFVYVDDLSSQQTDSRPENSNTSLFALLSPQAELDMVQRTPSVFVKNLIVSYSIPRQEQVELKVYDKLGREVKTLVSDIQNPGSYSFEINSVNLSYGVYYYRLTIGSFTEVKKIALVKKSEKNNS
jgi:hypothetical protein